MVSNTTTVNSEVATLQYEKIGGHGPVNSVVHWEVSTTKIIDKLRMWKEDALDIQKT